MGEKYWSRKRKSGKNFVTCKKFSHFSPTFFFPDKVTSEIFFFRNHAENVAGGLVQDLFLFCKKALDEVKASGLQLSFSLFR